MLKIVRLEKPNNLIYKAGSTKLKYFFLLILGQRGHISSHFSDNLDSSIAVKDCGAPKAIIQEAIYTTDPREKLAPPKIITSQGARPSSSSSVRSKASVSIYSEMVHLKTS